MKFTMKIFLLLFVSDVCAVTIKFLYLRPMSQSSVASFPSGTIQTYIVRSKLDCVRRCYMFPSCAWVAYTALAPNNGSCGCLSSCATASTNTTNAPGTVYFKLCGGNLYNTTSVSAWLNKACATNGDCPVENSVCYQRSSTCLCTPGYYYSISCDICLQNCDPRNLRKTFVKYQGACLRGYDDLHYSGVTSQQCQVLCKANTRCLTLDFCNSSSICDLSYDTAMTSNAFLPNCFGYVADHYQRMCC